MNKKEYTAPTLTVVEFKAENGYVNSLLKKNLTLSLHSMLGTDAEVVSQQESWSSQEDLFGTW